MRDSRYPYERWPYGVGASCSAPAPMHISARNDGACAVAFTLCILLFAHASRFSLLNCSRVEPSVPLPLPLPMRLRLLSESHSTATAGAYVETDTASESGAGVKRSSKAGLARRGSAAKAAEGKGKGTGKAGTGADAGAGGPGARRARHGSSAQADAAAASANADPSAARLPPGIAHLFPDGRMHLPEHVTLVDFTAFCEAKCEVLHVCALLALQFAFTLFSAPSELTSQ